MRLAVAFLGATFLLVGAGCLLYVVDSVGWAQCLFVLASGTAGAAAVLFTDHGGDR